MGLFGAAHGAKRSLSPKMCHTYPKYETSHSYILPEEYPKIICLTWPTPWVMLTSVFFYLKSPKFVISRNTNIDCILIYNF